MNDRCAGCFAMLTKAPLGGRYACTRCQTQGYWSTAIPEAGKLVDIRLVSNHDRPTLYFYGATL